MSKIEDFDFSLAIEKAPPRIQFRVLETHLSEIKRRVLYFAQENKVNDIVSIETHLAEVKDNPAAWFDVVLSLDWQAILVVLKDITAIIAIGNFFYKVLKFLRKRRNKKQLKKLKIDCTTSVSLAINHLRRTLKALPSQIKLIHLNRLAYHCVAVFVSPMTNPTHIIIVTTSIEGRITNFNSIKL